MTPGTQTFQFTPSGTRYQDYTFGPVTATAASQSVGFMAVAQSASTAATVMLDNVRVVLSAAPFTPAGLSLYPATVTGGSSSLGTVTLSSYAPPGGVVVALQSDNPAATVPASVTVPGGQRSTAFTVTTTSVAPVTTATITAAAGGVMQTATLTITPASGPSYLSNLTISPTAITGGSGTTGTVTLSSPAPAGGTTVALSSNSSAVVVPANVVIPQGAVGQTFAVTTSSVSSMTYATLTAKNNNWTQAVIATVLPANQSYAIQNLVAAAGNQCVVLNWSDLPPGSNEGYKVYRNGALLTPTPQEAAMFADNAVTNGTTYQYAVSVINSQGQEINLSSAVAATPSSSSGTLGWVNPPTTAVTGDLVLYATLSSGVNADNYAFVVDGREVGEGGQQPDDNSSSPGQVSVTLDTTSLSNGTHSVQLISELGDAPAATPPLIIQTNNSVNNKSLSGLVDLSAGEVFSMSATLPNAAATWTVTLTDDDTGNTITSWQGTGATVHLSWDGAGNTGNYYYTAHVTAKDSAGNVVAGGAFGSPGGSGDIGGGADFPAHTYFGTVHGLALVDFISPKRAHDVLLETTIKNAFKQMQSNDNSFSGLVLDPTAAGTTKQQRYSVYKKIQAL